MEKENHIFQGMRRDNHQIKQKSEFLWDALNIRITNREDSTLFSITNEKGTSNPLLTLPDSKYVGHCVLGKYLVVFTEEGNYSAIHRIEKTNSEFKHVVLYRGKNKIEEEDDERLWSTNNLIQTLGSYETDLVQKVYWIDGKHQPRVINITLPELKGVKPNELEFTDTSFDFVQTLKLEEEVTVIKQYGSGMFAPGVIQYAFTYYNKYGQETNIFYTTPLQYISYKDRGGKPDEKIANTFKIRIDYVDDFDYVRIYSIHRTSLDAVPTVKLVSDVEIKGAFVEYIDTGTVGEIVDNNYLLYVGGRDIVPQCMTIKDNTLFLGNVKLKDNQNDYRDIINESSVTLSDTTLSKTPYSIGNTYYENKAQLSDGNSARFKTNEIYRLGVQVQDKKGIWSSPIYIGDKVLSDIYPQDKDGVLVSSSKEVTVNANIVNQLIDRNAVNIRTCIVFPSVNDRSIICQGVLCPTVYSADGRKNSTVYSMPSWFFRTAGGYDNLSVEYRHNHPLYAGATSKAEIQNMVRQEDINTVSDIDNDNYSKCQSYFFIDENIVTFHSPDIELGNDLIDFPFEGVGLDIIGISQLGALYEDIDITTASTEVKGTGFIHRTSGFRTFYDSKYNKGGGGLFYNGALIKKADNQYEESDEIRNFFVYPWHRNGSLNNDEARSDSSKRTAVLLKKKLSHLKFFDRNIPFTEKLKYSITVPELHSSTELSMLKVDIPYNKGKIVYNGNIDTVIHSEEEYPIYISEGGLLGGTDSIENIFNTPNGSDYIKVSTEPVRMKYKSTPHLVFALNSDNTDIPILPRHSSLDNLSEDEFNIPSWWGNMDVGNPEADKDDVIERKGIRYYMPASNMDYLTVKKGFYDVLSKGIKNDSGKYSDNLNDVIVQVSPNICMVMIKDAILPGTSNEDYTPVSSNKPDGMAYYTGDIRYYKIVDTGETNEYGNKVYELEPLISQTPTKAPSVSTLNIVQKSFSEGDGDIPYLLLAEITREVDETIRFGGNNEYAYKSNIWFPASKPVRLIKDKPVSAEFVYGDTWYQRYDCLKTYAFTTEDQNQIIEIGSFLCETRVNLDGRCDRNKGNLSNLDASPENFNIMNEVYNQKDTFFNYRILDEDFYKSNKYANQVTWTLEKVSGADVDNWTNITLANVQDMDGSKGEVTSLNVWNDNLLCLQERQLSQLLYNSRVQIPVSDGVPIEIGNGRKMEGTRIISDSIGCSDRFSNLTTSNGLYFIDKRTDGLYLFNGQITNISNVTGMTWWMKEHHDDSLRLFNDVIYGDVYIVPEFKENALCFSEKLGQFTSQMSYGKVPAMFNYEDGFYSLNNNLKLYQNNTGKYNDFYGVSKPWYFSFISNDNPTVTKVFDTVDLRMDMCDSEGLSNESPIDYINVHNEYQDGESTVPNTTSLRNKNMMRKFRIWRGIIPREKGTRHRIRNPWTMITLGHEEDNNKVVIHDVSVNYHM